MANLYVKNLNRYDAFDYKLPMSFMKTDYRAANHRSHQFNHPQEVPKPIPVYSSSQVLKQNPIHVSATSETCNQFSFKPPFIYQPRAADLPYRNQRLQCIKGFDERLRWQCPRPINEYQASSVLAFTEKSLPEELPLSEHPVPSKIERPIVEALPEGFGKYLDPYVSTTKLDHGLFTIEQQHGIARKNAITFWDWMDYPKTSRGFGLKNSIFKQKFNVEPTYDKATFKEAVTEREKRRIFKLVPNVGMTTEVRENYKVPVQDGFQFAEASVTAPLVPLTGYKPETTENVMYGSEKRVDEILKCRERPIRHFIVENDCRN